MGMFLLLGNSPGLLLFLYRELLSPPCFAAETICFLRLVAAICPNMGIRLYWLCYDLSDGGGGGGSVLSIMLIQKDGANTGEGQDMSWEDKSELAFHASSCKKQGEGGRVFFDKTISVEIGGDIGR